MQVFHTSPAKIEKVSKDGLFDSGLFFSSRVYSMGKVAVVYSLEIDKNEILSAGGLVYEDWTAIQPIIETFASIYALDVDTALDVISEREVINLDDADFQFDVQRYALKCAKALGYRGVALQDEQGAAYLIDMFEKEHELTIEE